MKRLRNISILVMVFFTFNIVITYGNQDKTIFIKPASAKIAKQDIQSVNVLKPTVKKAKGKSRVSASKRKRKASKVTVIGSYQTTLIDKNKNRVRNIKLAARKINNYTILPGQTFSFNEVVGKRTTQRGYRYARIIVDGKPKVGIGGGICQLSTTLFNAAKKSNLYIIERNPHSKQVHYVPKGWDAAVDYGNLDLKFKNTKKYPVKIKASVRKGKISISIIKIK